MRSLGDENSRNQVGIIRRYLFDLALEHFNVSLNGKECTRFLSVEGKPVYIHWCSTNTFTAQGYSGDLDFDEFCWIPNCQEICKIAFPMATLGDYFISIDSTPSYKKHYSYRVWKGETEEGEQADELINFRRKTINIHDAIKGGNTLVNLEKIQKRFTERQFKNLYLCEWVDDSDSIFTEDNLKRCFYRESVENEAGDMSLEYAELPAWEPSSNRILVGYDPNGGGKEGHQAGMIVLEVRQESGKLRVLEHHTFVGKSPDWQFGHVKRVLSKYMKQISYLGIDESGPGARLFARMLELKKLTGWNAQIEGIKYDYNNKNVMAWHVEQIISEKKFEMNWNDKMLITSFMSVKITGTAGGRMTVVSTQRNHEHGELFWSLANAATKFDLNNSLLKRTRGLSYYAY